MAPWGRELTRVARRARRGDFWVVEADLVAVRGDVEIRARHLISNRDNCMPTPGGEQDAAAPPRGWPDPAGQLPLAL